MRAFFTGGTVPVNEGQWLTPPRPEDGGRAGAGRRTENAAAAIGPDVTTGVRDRWTD